jgi:hypothetical protein
LSLDEVIAATARSGEAPSDTDESLDVSSRASVKRKATQSKRQQATQNLNYYLEQVVKIMAEPVKIISTDAGSEWISKANKLWQEEFSHVDFLVTREVKTEWQSNWRAAQMFVEESRDYRQSLISTIEDQSRRKRHRRDLSDDGDAFGVERACPGRRNLREEGVSDQPVDADRSLKSLEGAELTSEQVLALERLLQNYRGEK